jgi:hypothetical protein
MRLHAYVSTNLSGKRKEETIKSTLVVEVHEMNSLCTYLSSVKGSSDLSSTKGKSHVSRMCSSDGVHGNSTSLVSSLCKCSLGVDIYSRSLKCDLFSRIRKASNWVRNMLSIRRLMDDQALVQGYWKFELTCSNRHCIIFQVRKKRKS